MAAWESPDIESWISNMKSEMNNEDSHIFHELASTWAVWAMLPIEDAGSAELANQARGAVLRAVHKLQQENDTDSVVDWRKVCAIYKKWRLRAGYQDYSD